MSEKEKINIWDALPFACVLSDMNGSVVDLNSAAENFFNVARKIIIKKSIINYLNIDIDLLSYFKNFSESSRKFRFKDLAIYMNGEKIFTDMWIISINEKFLLIFYSWDNNNLDNVFLSESASQSVVSMAEMLAHEIKNPIAGITGAAQLLEMTLSSKDRQLTGLIIDETKRILNLVRQFDEFGDLREPKFEALNIHDILESSKKASKTNMIDNISIENIYDPSLPNILGDRIQLEQVFINIVQNSINALKETKNGLIVFKTYFETGLVLKTEHGEKKDLPLHIHIEDNGPGIADNLIDKIFEPFITGSLNGTGLGLSLVSKIILSHHGLVKAMRVNDRTIFKISLPVAKSWSI